MAKYILIAFVAFFVLQGAIAKPKGKAAPAPEKTQLEELAANAQILVNNVTATLQGDLPDSKKVVETLNTNAQNLANHVQTVVNKIKTETKNHQGDIDSALKQVEQKLAETAKKLQEAVGPENVAKAKEIRANLDKGLKDAVAQADKLLKAVEPDATKAKNDLTNAAKVFLDQIVEISNNLKDQVKTLDKH